MPGLLTVTAAAASLALLSRDELRAAIGATTGANDVALAALGLQAAAAIATHCNISSAGATPPTLRQETLTEVFRLTCSTDALMLARRPIVSVTSIVEDDVTLDADDYEIDAGPAFLRRLSDDWPMNWSASKITVVYVAGWATVPADLKMAAQKLVQSLWAEAGTRDPSAKRIEIPGVLLEERWVGPATDPLINGEIADALSRFRNPVIG